MEGNTNGSQRKQEWKPKGKLNWDWDATQKNKLGWELEWKSQGKLEHSTWMEHEWKLAWQPDWELGQELDLRPGRKMTATLNDT